jgi:hypothetical protein
VIALRITLSHDAQRQLLVQSVRVLCFLSSKMLYSVKDSYLTSERGPFYVGHLYYTISQFYVATLSQLHIVSKGSGAFD